jgi:hypothetical protein
MWKLPFILHEVEMSKNQFSSRRISSVVEEV